MKTKADITISKAERILKKLNINLDIVKSFDYLGKIKSVAIRDKKIPSISSSGAGYTEKEAYACALGELLERLQNGDLLYQIEVCPKTDFYLPHFINNGINDGLRKYQLSYEENDISFYQFIEAKTNEMILVSGDYLKKCCGSSGMSSGITNVESITHGILEIVERYLIRFLYSENPAQLSNGKLDWNSLPIGAFHDVLKHHEKEGYHCHIFDYSIKGQIPGVFTLLLNADTGKYRCAVGVGVSTVKAIERSIIDLFRGSSDNELLWPFQHINGYAISNNLMGKNRTKNYQEWLMKCFFSGELPAKSIRSFLLLMGKSDFIDDIELEELIMRVSSMGWEIFIRNVNILGFPAHQIFIPGKSEVNDPNNFKYHDLAKLRSMLYCKTHNIQSLFVILKSIGECSNNVSQETIFIKFLFPEILCSPDERQLSFWQAVAEIQSQIIKQITVSNNSDISSHDLKAIYFLDLAVAIENGEYQIKHWLTTNKYFDIDLAQILGLPMRGDCLKCVIANNCKQFVIGQMLKEFKNSTRMSSTNYLFGG